MKPQTYSFRLIVFFLILVMLIACNFPLIGGKEDEQQSTPEPQQPSVSQEEPGVMLTPTELIPPVQPDEGDESAPPPLSTYIPQDCTLFVAVDGDDSGSGDESQPWRTIQHAVDTASAGDVICVASGTYGGGEALELGVSGAVAQPITIIAPAGEVIFQGAVNFQQGVSHLRFHGFTVTGYDVWGIMLYGDNQDIILSGLDVYGGEAALHFTSGYSGEEPEYGPVDQIIVQDSVFHDVVYTAVDCTPGPCNDITFHNLEIYGAGLGEEASYGSDGLGLERGRNVLVEDCYIHDNSGDGIDLNSRDQMLGYDAGVVIVQRNRVEDNALNGIKLWRGGEASNNLVWNMGDTLLVLEQGSNYHIVNNTFATCQGYTYLAAIGYDPAPGSTSAVLYNNIFYNDNPDMGGTLLYVSGTVNLDAGNNLYYNPYREVDVICTEYACYGMDEINDSTLFAESGLGEGSLYADPLFIEPKSGNLHLSGSSPALDAGSSEYAPVRDLEGGMRPTGSWPDIGAYEFQGK